MIKENKKIVSVILISFHQDIPLVSYIFTIKECCGRGMAYSLLLESLQSLYNMGYKKVKLFVTNENDRAIKIYRKVGFQEI
ncbi:GNAT family N-acetyltransferase [Rummeliibacillus suwonensis]|uniref:GNAT family N-acetyltransferase n=1 Tax=Rummeliibacillus suwonensis TaxID=1306154 RepID=UPI001AAF26D7|nr:GNAT family N-acetyltransferase [Rummeliibacillus suwonensis]